MTPGTCVLVVDDERNIRSTLSVCLESMGCSVTAVGTRDGAHAAAERSAYEVCFLDFKLGEDNGMDLLPRLLAVRPLAVVVVTAYATFDTAVERSSGARSTTFPSPSNRRRSDTWSNA
jgi:NtrC-family two-component system response regulator AlgB